MRMAEHAPRGERMSKSLLGSRRRGQSCRIFRSIVERAPFSVRRFFFIVQALLFACAGFAWLAGCPASTLLGIAPITGIDIPIATLLQDSSLGCGTGADDVFMYAVVVAYPVTPTPVAPPYDQCPNAPGGSDKFIAGAVFPCFATATFGNLPEQEAGALTDSGGALPDGGTVDISVWVAFYNQETFKKNEAAIYSAVDPEAGVAGALCQLPATWTTTCIATETDNLDVNAACPSGLTLGTSPPPPDAASDSGPADAPAEDSALDAGSDAPESDAAPEGGHDGATDAPSDAPPG
jgi:hypothetical protein